MKKNLGPGSLSLLLTLMALTWCWSPPNDSAFCLGDYVLGLLGLPAWSNGENGFHYTLWYSLIFLIPATVLGRKFSQDRFAPAGKWISRIISTVLTALGLCLIIATH